MPIYIPEVLENRTESGRVLNYIARIYFDGGMLEGRCLTPGQAIDRCFEGQFTNSIGYTREF